MRIDFSDCTVRHDGRQYILSETKTTKEGKNKGETYESTIGCFSDEDQLLKGLIKHGMVEGSINSVNHIKEMITASSQYVKAVVESRHD